MPQAHFPAHDRDTVDPEPLAQRVLREAHPRPQRFQLSIGHRGYVAIGNCCCQGDSSLLGEVFFVSALWGCPVRAGASRTRMMLASVPASAWGGGLPPPANVASAPDPKGTFRQALE